MKFNERKLNQVVTPYLKKCRAGDLAHAKRVVYWVKRLGHGRKDLPFLIMAGLMHDIGWFGIAPKRKLLLGEVIKLNKKSSKNSKHIIVDVLKNFEANSKDIKTVQRLVRSTEIYKSKGMDEKIMVDADNLSKLSIIHVRNKYKKSTWPDALALWQKKMPKRIKTKMGKRVYPGLLKKLEKSI